MLHRGGSCVNLISDSPINTSYTTYGALNFDYLDDTSDVPRNYHKTENSDIFCPVQIHVNPRKEDPGEKNLLDFDSDDDLLDNEKYILIDEDLSFDITPKRHLYPDANSHSNYNFFNDKSRSTSPFKMIATEQNQESNSHTNYVFSDTFDKNEETSYEDGSPYSIENSHRIYKILSESSGKIDQSLSTELLIPADDHIANQIFVSKMKADDESSLSSRCTEETETSSTCDICLIQIEESLLNIEKNLQHVQDLDIPELKHLLYNSPSIERSLFRVQDLLRTENIESVRRTELFNLVSDESLELHQTADTASNLENIQDAEQVKFSSGKNLLSISDEKIVNFVSNSLSRIPAKYEIINSGKNIRMCFSEENLMKDCSNLKSVTYNSNNTSEEIKCFKKVHSRSTSLDENSIFQSTKFQGEKLFPGKNHNFQESEMKSWADLDQIRIQQDLKVPQLRRSRKRKTLRLAEVEAKAEEFRRKIKNIISSRKVHYGFPKRKKLRKTVGQSPPIRITSTDSCNNGKDEYPMDTKTFVHDRRKRKKIINKSQTRENAVVPKKLISLLLAALLQAVKCLKDLVEGAFRSISFEQNGLLQ